MQMPSWSSCLTKRVGKSESCEKGCLGCCAGDRVDSIDFWSMRVRDLEQRITIARQAALDNPPTTSYFVFFSNQKDAAIAAQTNLHAEDGHSFRVMEAPGPEEVGFAVCELKRQDFAVCIS